MRDATRRVTTDPPDCFDPSLAAFETHVLPAAAIVDPLHVTHAAHRIGEYREAMRRGDRFPPVSVVRLFGRYWLADGHKRLTACRSLGVSHVVVEIWTFRRWLGDQLRQLVAKASQVGRVVVRVPVDPEARRAGRRLALDTLGHWRRLGRSLTGTLHSLFGYHRKRSDGSS